MKLVDFHGMRACTPGRVSNPALNSTSVTGDGVPLGPEAHEKIGRSRLESERYGVVESAGRVTADEDIATVAGQLADLTRTVEQMERQLKALREGADSAQERADVQQERIDLAARELAEVSDRLQAAARALRASI